MKKLALVVLTFVLIGCSCGITIEDNEPLFSYSIEVKYLDNKIDTLTVISRQEPRLSDGGSGSTPSVWSRPSNNSNEVRIDANYVKTMKILKTDTLKTDSLTH